MRQYIYIYIYIYTKRERDVSLVLAVKTDQEYELRHGRCPDKLQCVPSPRGVTWGEQNQVGIHTAPVNTCCAAFAAYKSPSKAICSCGSSKQRWQIRIGA